MYVVISSQQWRTGWYVLQLKIVVFHFRLRHSLLGLFHEVTLQLQ